MYLTYERFMFIVVYKVEYSVHNDCKISQNLWHSPRAHVLTYFSRTLKALGLVPSYFLTREAIYGAAGGVRGKVKGGEEMRRHRPNRDRVN